MEHTFNIQKDRDLVVLNINIRETYEKALARITTRLSTNDSSKDIESARLK